MEIYLFFKRYFVFAGKWLALFLHSKGMSPNTASVGSLFVIFPMFYGIGAFLTPGWTFGIVTLAAILIKLVLNAVDGIIARERQESTKIGMALNVGTDIWPDMFVISMILSAYGITEGLIYGMLVIIGAYLLGEMLFIVLFGKQNLFFGKDLRTFFYIVLAGVLYFGLDPACLLYYYLIISLVHVTGFFLPKYRA